MIEGITTIFIVLLCQAYCIWIYPMPGETGEPLSPVSLIFTFAAILGGFCLGRRNKNK